MPARAQGVELLAAVPSAQSAGAGRLRVWGFDVYDARLWVAPGFRQGDFARHAFALEIDYLRDLSAADIARRSIDQMRRVGSFHSQGERWQAQLEAALPDVRRGDRLTGIYRPGRGATFLHNGRASGEIADTQFAALFFGIWLSPQTSEPALREKLLAGTTP